MFSANQITGFFNQPYLQNKSMRRPVFLYVNTNSRQLKIDQKIFGWAWSEMGVTSLVTGLENWLYLKSELMEWTDFFCMLLQVQES